MSAFLLLNLLNKLGEKIKCEACPSFYRFFFATSWTHLCRMFFPLLINWMSPLGCIFQFYSNFKRNFCLQTVENLIRRRILQHLIWFCTVCRCLTKRTRERSGSMVECLTRNRGAAGLSLTGVTVLWSLSKTHLS